MNDLELLYQSTMAYNGGIVECDLWLMNLTPQANLNHHYSVDMAKALCRANQVTVYGTGLKTYRSEVTVYGIK